MAAQQRKPFRLGLIINPYAGIGGSVALKGSDGPEVATMALEKGAIPMAEKRMLTALSELETLKGQLEIVTVAGAMGENVAKQLGFTTEVAYLPKVVSSQSKIQTSPEDTENAVLALSKADVDMILFAGGDGTARNICAVAPENSTVLGVPAGCKIHSGVYAISPKAAGRVVKMLVAGELVSLIEADVMDIDESLFREGIVRAKRYGELQIPSELRYVQNVKMGGKESDELILQDIAAHVIEGMDEDTPYIMGSGSTVAFIMEELGLDNTLLGVDVIRDQELVQSDVTASWLQDYVASHSCKLVITLIGGQGHIFGRGNQQLSPEVIRAIGRENIIVVATKAKLNALNGRPLIADSGDVELDKELSGPITIVTGYHDQVIYPVGYEEL